MIASALLSLIAIGALAPDAGDAVLTDQNGTPDSLGAHRGRVVAALVVKVSGLRGLKKWEVALRERLAEPEAVDFLRVADVPPGRGITRERILHKLEGRVPPEVSILLDMEGAWREAYGLDTSAPNLLLIDRDGQLVHLIRGRPTERVVSQAVERLAELLEGE